MQEQSVQLWEREIHYKSFENSHNFQTILILHGWWWKSDSWIEVWELLSDKWCNVIIPDLPWFGKTEITKNYTLEDYAETIEDFCEKLKLESFILWWHSNGWAISITLENRWNLHIERLVLNNSAWIRKDEKRSLKRKMLNSFAKLVKKVLKKLGTAGLLSLQKTSKIRSLFYRFIWSQDYLEAEKNPLLKQTYLNMISSDLQEQIEDIDTDTLLVWWEKDSYTPESDAHLMRRLIKKSKIVVLDNETHWIHLKNPKRLVQTFIDNI